jgi:hypothetical protein
VAREYLTSTCCNPHQIANIRSKAEIHLIFNLGSINHQHNQTPIRFHGATSRTNLNQHRFRSMEPQGRGMNPPQAEPTNA